VRFKTPWPGPRRRFVPVAVGSDDIAVLQYTGGTTGVSKGAVLLHRNIIANTLQCEAWFNPVLQESASGRAGHQHLRAAALPHLRVHGEHDAGHAHRRRNILIPNPRDLKAVFKDLQARSSTASRR
jgi:long-chain acyl-CoA synthetase